MPSPIGGSVHRRPTRCTDNLAFLILGIVVIGTLFNFAGLGRLMVEAVTTRDIQVVQVCAMIFCSVYVGLNLLADVVAIVANPRLRYPK